MNTGESEGSDSYLASEALRYRLGLRIWVYLGSSVVEPPCKVHHFRPPALREVATGWTGSGSNASGMRTNTVVPAP
jgi:hypothetical protein